MLSSTVARACVRVVLRYLVESCSCALASVGAEASTAVTDRVSRVVRAATCQNSPLFWGWGGCSLISQPQPADVRPSAEERFLLFDVTIRCRCRAPASADERPDVVVGGLLQVRIAGCGQQRHCASVSCRKVAAGNFFT